MTPPRERRLARALTALTVAAWTAALLAAVIATALAGSGPR